MVQVKLYGSDDCDRCMECKKHLKSLYADGRLGVDFQFIDAMADENQDECDENEVWDLPHVQVISAGKLLKVFIEPRPQEVSEYIEMHGLLYC
jgi:glutaredoxin-related protein